jgi:hypothetical protein
MKFAAALRMKYSSAMFRPPDTETLLSAMNSLLCMRMVDAPELVQREQQPRCGTTPARAGSGLKMRTCTFGYAASAANSSSSPAAYRSSTIRRTRTPAHRRVAQLAQELQPDRVLC